MKSKESGGPSRRKQLQGELPNEEQGGKGYEPIESEPSNAEGLLLRLLKSARRPRWGKAKGEGKGRSRRPKNPRSRNLLGIRIPGGRLLSARRDLASISQDTTTRSARRRGFFGGKEKKIVYFTGSRHVTIYHGSRKKKKTLQDLRRVKASKRVLPTESRRVKARSCSQGSF